MAAVRKGKGTWVLGYLGTYPDNADVTVTDVKATTGTVTTTQIRSYRNPNPAPRLWGAAGERDAKTASGKKGRRPGRRETADSRLQEEMGPETSHTARGTSSLFRAGGDLNNLNADFSRICRGWRFLAGAGAAAYLVGRAWLRARCYRRVSVMVMMLSRDSTQFELLHHDRDYHHDETKTSTSSF